jgi:hypothetical protein
MKKPIAMTAISLCIGLVAVRTAFAGEQPGAHPAYLHALTDLREARANLEKRAGDAQMKWDENTAIKKIDDAINEIKKASINDGKDLKDHPPVDTKLDRKGRLHHALELLERSHKDIKEKESNNNDKGLQKRALEHIDGAINITKQGIANSK